jgi:hypothetical protein
LPRRRGGSAGSRCGTPFFPRVLIHLIDFHHRIRQSVGRAPCLGMGLNTMPKLQQLYPVCAQFTRQMRGALALRKSLQKGDDMRARSLGPLPDSTCERIVNSSTGAAVVQHRSSVPSVDRGLRYRSLTAATMQSVGMQEVNQPLIALLFIQQIDDWKSKHSPASEYPCGYRPSGLEPSHR